MNRSQSTRRGRVVGAERQHRRRTVPGRLETGLATTEHALTLHRRSVGCAIVVVAVLLRLLYFVQFSAVPSIVGFQRWPETDMHYFDAWGREIASGDVLSRDLSIPMHRWQSDIAVAYVANHPSDQPSLDAAALADHADVESLLWRRWLHVPQFYQDPLYAYAVGALYYAFGTDLRIALACQLALGVLSIVLIWCISRRFFGELVGAVAAGLGLLCAPLLFYEGLLLRDSVIVCGALILTCLASTMLPRAGVRPLIVVGFAVGVCCLLKSTFLLFAAAVAFALIGERRRSATRIAACGFGFVCALAPLVLRNVAVGVPPFAIASSGPLNFVSSNEAHYLPDVGLGIDVPLLAQFEGDTSGTWTAAVRTVASDQTVSGYIALLWEKWTRAWHWYEIPSNENFYYTRRLIPVLAWLPLTFRWIAPLGIIGIVLTVRGIRARWPLFVLLVVALAPLLAFFVLGRFRATLIAATIPFAAYVIVETARLFGRRRFRRAALVTAGVLVCAAWTGQPLGPHQVLIRTSDWILPYSVLYESRIEAAVRNQRWAAGAHVYAEYFDKYEPAMPEILGSGDVSLGRVLARMHRQCAELFDAGGDAISAKAQLATADRLDRLRISPLSVSRPWF